jgi:hypothetical protein
MLWRRFIDLATISPQFATLALLALIHFSLRAAAGTGFNTEGCTTHDRFDDNLKHFQWEDLPCPPADLKNGF